LPIEQPTRFELIVNTKTAKAQNIEIPTLILAQADQIIESEPASMSAFGP
jgi:putative tryptophan/tyrosine transport system substrate-binding protein